MKRLLSILCFGSVFLFAASFTAASDTPIPKSYFGIHVNRPGHWPMFAAGSLRLWDNGTPWAKVEPSRGTFDWTTLDAWVHQAQAQGMEVVYTFGKTPAWSASAKYEPPSNIADWDDFVTALATRYKGQIKYYEGWNEANNERQFYRGSMQEMVTLQQHAYQIIHRIDPDAKVLSPAPEPKGAGKWLAEFFSAGGGPYVDIVAFHGYTPPQSERILELIKNIRNKLPSDQASKPLWDTEGGWAQEKNLSDYDLQAAFLAKHFLLQWSAGVDRFFWYGWDYQSWGTLWDQSTGIHKAGKAYTEVEKWMLGAVMSKPCSVSSDLTWTCGLTRAGGYQALVVWSMSDKDYHADSQYKQARDLDGNVTNISGSVPLTAKPILLETGSAF